MAVTQGPTSPFCDLPPELRNQIYSYIAYDNKAVRVHAHHGVVTVPLPIGQVSYQTRKEFNGLHDGIPLTYVSRFTILNINLSIWELILSLGKIPRTPAAGVNRTVVLQVHLTNSLTTENIQTFVKAVAGELAEAPETIDGIRILQYRVTFDEAAFDLNKYRVIFARLSKKYRFHHSDGEQRVFEKVYWAFAEQAEKVDGVSVKQFALGCWFRKDGAFAFA